MKQSKRSSDIWGEVSDQRLTRQQRRDTRRHRQRVAANFLRSVQETR